MQLPEIGEGNCILVCTVVLCVFRPAIPRRSVPTVAPSALPDEVVIIHPFRFRVQRYYNYLIYASVLAKKLQKYVVKHKKEGAKAPLSLEKSNTHAIKRRSPAEHESPAVCQPLSSE